MADYYSDFYNEIVNFLLTLLHNGEIVYDDKAKKIYSCIIRAEINQTLTNIEKNENFLKNCSKSV